MLFNINNYVKVKLTDKGREFLRKRRENILGVSEWSEQEDAEGWSKWQLHHLMEVFGSEMIPGFDLLFDPTIEICEYEEKLYLNQVEAFAAMLEGHCVRGIDGLFQRHVEHRGLYLYRWKNSEIQRLKRVKTDKQAQEIREWKHSKSFDLNSEFEIFELPEKLDKKFLIL